MSLRNVSAALLLAVENATPMLRSIEEQRASVPCIAGGWSSKQILGHLIDSAINNHQRFVRAALAGSLVWPGYDQNGCVRIEGFQGAPWAMLVGAWSSLNTLLAHVLEQLPADSAQVQCRIGEDPLMSLQELADSYLDHLSHHLEQLRSSAL